MRRTEKTRGRGVQRCEDICFAALAQRPRLTRDSDWALTHVWHCPIAQLANYHLTINLPQVVCAV